MLTVTTVANRLRTCDVCAVQIDESGSINSTNFKNYVKPFAKQLVQQLVTAGVYKPDTQENAGKIG
jgi:hypothetical protein